MWWFLWTGGAFSGLLVLLMIHAAWRDWDLEQQIMTVITRPMYGIEIQQALVARYQRHISVGALYPKLAWLVREGFLVSEPRNDDLPYEERSGARRYYYSKTGKPWHKPSPKARLRQVLNPATGF